MFTFPDTITREEVSDYRSLTFIFVPADVAACVTSAKTVSSFQVSSLKPPLPRTPRILVHSGKVPMGNKPLALSDSVTQITT